MHLPETITKLYEDGTITITPLHKRTGKISEIAKLERKARLTEIGNIKKVFRFTSREKRLVKSSAIRLFHSKKNSIKWFTLTFTNKNVSQVDANKCLSKFLENLKKNYHANNYVIVREDQNKAGEYHLHYHCLIDIPFVSFSKLNNAWCRACSGFMSFSPNALTSGKKKIIDNIQGLVGYITKYISKTDQESDTRVYFISNDCLSRPAVINFNNYIYLTTSFESKTIVKDHFTIIFLKNFAFLPEMFVLKIPGRRKKEPKPIKNNDSFQPNFDF